jgi:hypothetical protein
VAILRIFLSVVWLDIFASQSCLTFFQKELKRCIVFSRTLRVTEDIERFLCIPFPESESRPPRTNRAWSFPLH